VATTTLPDLFYRGYYAAGKESGNKKAALDQCGF
jgi:hypothetical protein